MQLWEAGEVHDLSGRIPGQQHTGQQQPQTEEQRGKRACALAARASISKAVKGLVGGPAAGSAEHRKHWTTAMVPQSSDRGTPHRQNELKQRAQLGVDTGEQGRIKTVIALVLLVKLAPMSAPRPSGDRQEHRDATIAFAGAGQRNPGHLDSQVGHRTSPRGVPLPPPYATHVLGERQTPQFVRRRRVDFRSAGSHRRYLRGTHNAQPP